MEWIDGSIYKGEWHNGIQNGVGIMLFEDSSKNRAGFFKQNVFNRALK